MTEQSRRHFIGNLAAALGASSLAASPGGGEHRLHDIGVQLYTVRSIILNDPAQVLGAIDKIGFREAEVIWATMPKIWADLKRTNLKPVSIHMDSQLFKPDRKDDLETALQDIHAKGFQYVVYPAVPRPDRNNDLKFFEMIGETLNEVGAQCHKRGLQLCYHNHAFDFRQVGSTTPLATILSKTSPETLALEVDVFWVSVAGHDPVEILNQYSGRVPLLHLKNKPQGMPVQFNENVTPAVFKEVGDGAIDIKSILATATTIGVKHFFVEQDQTPGDPVASLRKSYGYLESLRF